MVALVDSEALKCWQVLQELQILRSNAAAVNQTKLSQSCKGAQLLEVSVLHEVAINDCNPFEASHTCNSIQALQRKSLGYFLALRKCMQTS